MPSTKRIAREQLESYFDAFTKRFLRHGSPEAIDIEVVSHDLGDQFVAEGARLTGLTYDPRDDSLEFAIELTTQDSADHRVPKPTEVWVVEEDDGFPSSVEVVPRDGARQVMTIRKVGLQRVR
jgi:hypothetical protein